MNSSLVTTFTATPQEGTDVLMERPLWRSIRCMDDFGESCGNPMPRVDIDTKFIVSAADILCECC
jgi:hypothetical protein